MSVSKFYRSNNELKVAGVCSGLGKYLQTDPTLVRLFLYFWLSITFLAFGSIWYWL